MSRAFTKEIDDKPEEVVERPVSAQPNYVTPNGLSQIERALAKYEVAHTAAISKENKTAIELTAREIRYWAARQSTAILAPPNSSPDHVHFGSTVVVRRHDGRVQTFRIVGEDEAEPSAGTISYVSPFARAVIGASVGDHVEISGEDTEVLAMS
jgi:transcription elongation GreA/GreB family factor